MEFTAYSLDLEEVVRRRNRQEKELLARLEEFSRAYQRHLQRIDWLENRVKELEFNQGVNQ